MQQADDMAAAIRSAFGGSPIHKRGNGRGVAYNVGYKDGSIELIPKVRPGAEKIKDLQGDSARIDAFLANDASTADAEEARIIRCNLIKGIGDALAEAHQYEEARSKYTEAIAAIIGKDIEIPLAGGMRSQVMHVEAKADRALKWFEEVNILYKNSIYAVDEPIFDWLDYNVALSDHYVQRLTALAHSSDILLELGNTGAAVQRRWLGQKILSSLPSHLDKPALHRIITPGEIQKITKFRHPDPKLTSSLELQNEKSQLRGSWFKVMLKKSGIMPTRMGFASFVWKGRLYIAGGEKSLDGPCYRDFWSLDLDKLDIWRPLPAYPISEAISGKFMGWQMAVHEDKAYLFNGRLEVDFFDLASQKWGSITTKYAGSDRWPYALGLSEYTMQMVDGRLYVFGGVHDGCQLGCNLFMVLNIGTREWCRLSGTALPEADNYCPGPRRYATSWVSEARDRIYLMYGEANRLGAKVMGERDAGTFGYGYDDMWSWCIPGGDWRKERMSGKPPCARSEMASTFNEKLNKVVVFGGYSPTLPTFYVATNDCFRYSYYADTFIFDPSTSRWKQVLTRGFPTYRAQAQLVSDPTTGKTFLFGGYTNTEFVPSRHYISRSFSDLWQLKLDVEGGFFDDVDLEEEARAAKVGPWQRCFNCGGVGPWKKCGGTCKGRVFFCEAQCLKEGWREHKTKHKCRKTT